jgi:F0F1-type ATP synthase assembly protein I
MPFNRPIPDPTPSTKPRTRLSSGVQMWVQAEKMVQIALVLPCAVVIGWGLGAWLDSRLHQSWMVLAGIVLGSVSGLTGAIRLAMAAGVDPKTDSKIGDGAEGQDSGKEP